MAVDARARIWFAVTALVVFVGIAIQVAAAMDAEGFFDTPAKRGLNVFVFFTIQANILVGISSALLALDRARQSPAFRALRLTALVSIAVTFVVFHAVLSDLQDLTGQAAVADFLLHTASPVLCIAGWLLFGPRGQTTPRIVALTLAFPLVWGVFTLVRGEIVDWYPYPFMEPFEHGYVRVAVNLALVAVVFAALAAGAHWLDQRLPRPATTAPTTEPASTG
ncbi:MAG: Pr6Pr family membrane protein [Acidimicrobiales bacterium]